MPLPSDFNTVTITGRYIDLAGNALAGTVTFTSSTTVVDASVPVTIMPVPIVATLDANGAFSIALPATDDPDISPTGYTYKVEERFGGKLLRSYNIMVPHGTVGSIDLSTVAPVDSVTASVQLLPLSGGTMTGPLVLSGNPTVTLGAATKGYVDQEVADASLLEGGTVGGNLTVNGTTNIIAPAASAGVSSLGRYALKLTSSFAGGENTADSTGRLELESYQKAQHLTGGGGTYAHYGEVIRIRSRKHNSKQMIAWYGPTSYDANGDPATADTAWFWMGAHYDPNDPGPAHGHWSVEVPDSNGDLQTRFELRIWDPSTGAFGMDRTILKMNAADVVVTQDNGALYMAGTAGTNKNLYFTNDTTVVSGASATGKRWGVQADSTAESGSNVGTDFRVNRYSDSGTFVDSPIFVKRSTGAVGIGNITAPAARLDVTEAGSRHTVEAIQTTTSTISFAAYAGILGSSANRYFDGRVSGDSSGRFVILGDGKIEWGNGGAGGRDTNLYRSTANVLKTDDMLITAIGLGVGNSAAATTAVGTLVRKMEVFDASGTSLGFVPIYSSIT
ncbi:hypothetical protein ACFWHW_13125 [Streptomyces pharetrae]|uniref:hypothetical protein n=1 Tax=Streptomyces pharetrae TaxID=291370 RepID=UPI00364CD6D8